jgi:hypothetical protein
MSVPLLYQKYSFFGGLLSDVFSHLSSLGESLYSFSLLFSLSLILFVFWGVFYSIEKITHLREKELFKKYGISFLFYFFLLLLGV